MTQRHSTHRGSGRRAALPLVLALIGSLLSVGSVAAGNGTTIVRGIQHEFGTCGADDDGYLMTGSLEGCWWIDTFEVKSDPTKSTLLATGTEHFIGCLVSVGPKVCGTFTTTYTYTAKFDKTGAEIHGRCHHPITGGIDGFDGVSGQLSFHDVLDGPAPYYPYVGNVHLARP